MTEESPGKRPTVAGIDEILGRTYPVLDHGFIRVIDYMGDDAAIVQAARVSYGKGTKSAREDEKLIRFLMRHRHTSPFEMCEIKLHVKLPIFVARQWIRHRTASVNELSARYSIVEDRYYAPSPDLLAPQSPDNRQGRTHETLPPEDAQWACQTIDEAGKDAYGRYQALLDRGLARESARMVLGVQYYTEWYWKINLRNLMHFIGLRIKENAQWEIRVYAQQLLSILRVWVPMTARAFEEYELGGVSVSKTMLAVLRRMLAGERVGEAESGLDAREWRELMKIVARCD